MSINERIISLVNNEKISKAEFARVTGISKSMVTNFEQNKGFPSYDTICRILKQFPGIDARWLITGENIKFEYQNSESKNIETNKTLNEKTHFLHSEINSYKNSIRDKEEIISLLREKEDIYKERNEELKNEINELKAKIGEMHLQIEHLRQQIDENEGYDTQNTKTA